MLDLDAIKARNAVADSRARARLVPLHGYADLTEEERRTIAPPRVIGPPPANRVQELAHQVGREAAQLAAYAMKLEDVATRSPVRAARCIAQLEFFAAAVQQRIDEMQNLQFPGEME